MEKWNNYHLQMQQAQQLFLSYDQESLIRKLALEYDDRYLYVNLLCKQYRLCRHTGSLSRLRGSTWEDANTFHEVMTLLDLVCDSSPHRHIAGQPTRMESFGRMFHRNLLESSHDPWAAMIQQRQQDFRQACLALGGREISGADMAFSFPVFEGLQLQLRFWKEDSEFPPAVQYFWDQNALMYLRYETMYYAVGLLKQSILDQMNP